MDLDISEKELIARIQNGEIDLYSYFVNKYTRLAFFYVRKKVFNPEDAKDIVQNAFINTYKAIERIDADRTFYPYFFSVLKNEVNQFFRNHRNNMELLDDMVASYEVDTGLDLSFAFAQIKPLSREVLELYYVEGFSYKDIAVKTGRPINTVKTLIRRAKSEVKKIYERK